EGSYTITVTITHDTATPDLTVTSAATIDDAALTGDVGAPDGLGGGYSVTGTENADTGTQTVASFVDPAGSEAVGDYSASIDWGDGNVTSGNITDQGGGLFTVDGANTYADEGSYTITVTITHDTATPDLTVFSTAT